jgi:putative transposase
MRRERPRRPLYERGAAIWGQTPGHVAKGDCKRNKSATSGPASASGPYAGFVARPPRLQIPGGIYHVTARGNRRQPIFLDEADYRRFLQILAVVVARLGWRCHAYCLMPNHYHLLIETPDANLSAGMQRLNGLYAQWFNRQHQFDGHLFQGRFHAVLVESNWHLLELSRYIVLNPVRAQLARDAGGWRWSSYRAATAATPRPAFLELTLLLEQFGREQARACEAFRIFVHDAPARAGPRR